MHIAARRVVKWGQSFSTRRDAPMALPKYESPETPISEEEYLEFEDSSEFRHEYANGQIFAMTGGSVTHSRIKTDATLSLGAQLAGSDCEVISGDLRVKVESRHSYRYPDVLVFCGGEDLVDDRTDTIRNPVLIVEVLSPSTQAIDRNEKFFEYRQIPSLQEYILISQDSPRVERFLRQESGEWLFVEVLGLDGVLDLPSIGCKLALADVYRRVTFEDEDEAAAE
jgi:Uma2 family endonuclease